MEGQPPFPHSEEPPPPPPGPHNGPGPVGPDGEHRSPRHGGHAHPNHHHRGSRGRGGRSFGGHDRFGHRGPPPFPLGGIDFAGLAEMFQRQLFGEQGRESESKEEGAQDDFQPEADVFDTETSYVVHVSLPGAKKEDVGVSWDSEKSELNVAGVIYRPGDEDFLKTLALDERKVGAFQRKIRLGSRANPAQVDDDAISAKLEDGVLRVEVPKLDKDYVEIKKVDIE
ncbi:uncharacterized protein K452DRAFT_247851 [Aplosporella prunicola CBS 121167]|uniref:SHSP domain-containing protein n=1 Tax=Aplosporella prunicola CBS 121167 TaxID=1176127 RepID=A0A6A6BJ60_9PEZI|nr:uncharacterized protein K452DRAFT_247851 [Aplosporella prunicola CBS 121167]KAF2143355.1 hypothetical protein K452DRAFT_247851 [Aplosporella prunicola CBS 121167]